MPKQTKTLTILIFIILVFGLVALSSAGVVEGQKRFDSAHYYLTHQLLYGVLPGLALFFIFSRVNYKFWRKLSLPLLLGAVCLMVFVFVPSIGLSSRGAQRWIDFGFFSFQPSEFLKLTMIIYLAAWFSREDGRSGSGGRSVVPFFLVLGFAGILLLAQPDMGTLALVTLIAISMYFFAGAKLKNFLIMILALGILLGAVAVIEPYRLDRLKTFLSPNIDTQGISYHVNQAMLGIGSGGIFGLGFGQSRQKFNFLPEPVGDSIFAIIVEEVGFVGGVFVILLFLLLAMTMVKIAKGSSPFGRLIVMGMSVWITGQAFVNIMAISGLIPLTGLPLPLVSFGSSSLVSILAGLGIVANISKH